MNININQEFPEIIYIIRKTLNRNEQPVIFRTIKGIRYKCIPEKAQLDELKIEIVPLSFQSVTFDKYNSSHTTYSNLKEWCERIITPKTVPGKDYFLTKADAEAFLEKEKENL